MNEHVLAEIASELRLGVPAVERTVALLDAGATVPFIARFRAEQTGGMNREALARLAELWRRQRDIAARKDVVIQSIDEQQALTDALREKILAARSRHEIDDLFLPYKPRPATRATKAAEQGLEPLADAILAQTGDAAPSAADFVSAEKELPGEDAVWDGARTICAERIAMNAEVRGALRKLVREKGTVVARLAAGVDESRASRSKELHELFEPVGTIPAHRVLAVRRAAKEGILEAHIAIDREEALAVLRGKVVKNIDSPLLDHLETALEDAFDRSLLPTLTQEAWNDLRDWAEEEAFDLIGKLVRHQLMVAPFGPHAAVAVTADDTKGAYLAALDGEGRLLESRSIEPGAADLVAQAAAGAVELGAAHGAKAFAAGKSAAGRQVEIFLRRLAAEDRVGGAAIVPVPESEAAVYSIGPAAREEFPDAEPGLRMAISIGRRLQDPLVELTKIDPRSIGSSPYHHDVDRTGLLEHLERVVTECVSAVGADVNRAGRRHLAYVPGIGPQIAWNVVKFRDDNGGTLRTLSALHQVKRVSDVAFQQCAGFLRLKGGENPLDDTGVHPERYALVEKMAVDLETDVAGLLGDAALRARVEMSRYIDENVGEPTIRAVLEELARPWPDPRPPFAPPDFHPEVFAIGDLKKGMRVPGIVTNIMDYGAFVDVGVESDGLVHISQLAHGRIGPPYDRVRIGQRVEVIVTEVDGKRARISLSLKAAQPAPAPRPRREPRAKDGPIRKPPEQGPREERRPPRDARPPRRDRERPAHDGNGKREPRRDDRPPRRDNRPPRREERRSASRPPRPDKRDGQGQGRGRSGPEPFPPLRRAEDGERRVGDGRRKG
ncbi:MAG: S1 RNA-binding domain-containing protein [Deltaproteobacteria bacterium]|nr:S1 RNA-binding domain-containing protein [Deltaproteobacteria bacterium]